MEILTREQCATCDGYGAVSAAVHIDDSEGIVTYGAALACPECKGSGKVERWEAVEKMVLQTVNGPVLVLYQEVE